MTEPTTSNFRPLFRSSPFLDSMGSFQYRGRGEDLVLGVRVEEQACNARGIAHAGFLTGLADVALGYALSTNTDPPRRYLTVNLSLDFSGNAKLGDWLETSVDIQKIGERIAFANAYVQIDETRIVRASGVFARVNSQRLHEKRDGDGGSE